MGSAGMAIEELIQVMDRLLSRRVVPGIGNRPMNP